MLRLALASALAGFAQFAQAATYIVDTTSDAVLDTCDAVVADDCSLRGAITAANTTPDADDIVFALIESDPGYQPDTAHWRITTASMLPVVTNGALVIDGFTQVGAVPNTNPPLFPLGHTLKIELRGTDPSSVNCLQSTASLTLRGLAMNNFGQAVYLFETGTHVVEGNYIGTDITGQNAMPNRIGVVLGGNVRIGGTLPSQGNVISNNRQGGLIQLRQVTQLRVQGNTLGLDAQQTQVLGVQDYGVTFSGGFADAVIGGSTAGEANIISGNAFNAISVFDQPQPAAGPPQLRIIGNLIGANFSGAALGNGFNPGSPSQSVPAIQIGRLGYCRVEIGGDAAGEGNLIAHNGNAGVAVGSCWGAPILGNTFLSNRGIAIDLAGSNNFDGPTPNDPGDVDGTGSDPFGAAFGNRLQNKVEVLSMQADPDADELLLTLRVDSAVGAAAYPLRIDIYRNDGFGTTPVATETVEENEAQQPLDAVLPLSLVGTSLAFTVTDAEGNTSELARAGGMFADGFEGDGLLPGGD